MKKISLIFSLLVVSVFFSCTKLSNKQASQRIVSLGPSATEILFAIGAQDQIVARTDLCNYPPEAEKIPSVGGFASNTISLETIISFEPDIVYLYKGIHDTFVLPLEKAGIFVYISDATSIEDVKKEVLDMGKLTNHLEQAKAVVFDMNTRLNKIETLIKKNSSSKELPKVYWEIWNEPMMSVGKNSFINDIIKKAGGQNIFEQEETSYPIVSAEAVIFARPDYIFYTTENSEKTAFWNMDNALENCKVIFMGEDERFVRSCPRCVEAVEILADILWQVR